MLSRAAITADTVPSPEPQTWMVNYQANVVNFACDGMSIAGGQPGMASMTAYLDEIRIGTNWTDVAGGICHAAAISELLV